MKKKIIIISIILYSVLILRLIVFKYPPGVTFGLADANLIPFKTIFGYLSGEPTWATARLNLLGNVVVLMPFGFLLAALDRKFRRGGILLVGLAIGSALELLQVIFRSGILDIDDIILNSLGVFIGCFFYIRLIISKKQKV